MGLYWRGALFIIVIGLMIGCQSSQSFRPSGSKVSISRVVSGNTVEWTDMNQQPPRVIQGRLIGTLAPGLDQQPWGRETRERLENLLLNNPDVVVEGDRLEEDKYSRKLVLI